MPDLEPLVTITGTATPLPLDNVDTDVITPMHRIMDGTIVEHAFDVLRVDADGNPRANPFDDPAHAEDAILVAGTNFGCGSSRETAVWAIRGLGYRVVVAESFGDIFHANCFKNAVLPITLPADDIQVVMAAARERQPMTVAVPTATISLGTRTIAFDLPDLRRTALIEGFDDLAVALQVEEQIAAFERSDRTRRPWVHDPPGFEP